MPGTDTVTVYIGEDVEIPFAHSTGEDITSWTIEYHVKGVAGFKTTATIVDGPAGDYKFSVTDAKTELLNPGRYSYAVWRVDDGNERPLADGWMDAKITGKA